MGEELLWSGWGPPGGVEPLPHELRRLLEAALGLERRDTPAVAPEAVRVAAGTLPDGARAALARACGGARWVREDHLTRLHHARGKSTVDLLRIRAGDAANAPDAVLLPSSHSAVAAILQACVTHDIAVIPFGGGTSVVGGVEPLRCAHAAAVSLDLRRLDRLQELDAVSMTARLGAGLRGPAAEALLAPRGLTLGHFPQSFEYATLGGYAVTRSSGQASAGYGRFDDLVARLRVATPAGDLDLGRGPGSAAGPDLLRLILGSEGVFGVVTDMTLRVRPAPEVLLDEAWSLADWETGVAAARALAQSDGAMPTVLRLSDPAESAVMVATGGAAWADAVVSGGCLLVTCVEGAARAAVRRRGALVEVLTAHGAVSLGEGPGRAWRSGRFVAPVLRDRILDIGGLVDTLETATSWHRLPALHADIRQAVRVALEAAGTPGLVLCHVSHVYPDGASLYFTVAARQAADPIAQWTAVKRAAGDAIAAAGATITHHHGVGLEHRPWMEAEVGPLGVRVLRAVKAALDPTGILNPGKLIPPATRAGAE